MGHEVTVYCRNHFTPALPEHNGMRLVRLPTIRSKHLETVIHTLLSTAHALTQRYDLVHYHALGPALFSLRSTVAWKKDRRDCAGAGLAAQEMGTASVGRSAAGGESVGAASQWNDGSVAGSATTLPRDPQAGSVLYAQRWSPTGTEGSSGRSMSGDSIRVDMSCSWDDFHLRKAATCWSRRLSRSTRM